MFGLNKKRRVSDSTSNIVTQNSSETSAVILEYNEIEQEVSSKVSIDMVIPEETNHLETDTTSLAEEFLHQIEKQNIRLSSVVLTYKDVLEDFSFENDSEMKVKVFKIKPDGNSLFTAVAHQLFCIKIGLDELESSAKKLRKNVVSYINTNFDCFEHILRCRVLEPLNINCSIAINEPAPTKNTFDFKKHFLVVQNL